MDAQLTNEAHRAPQEARLAFVVLVLEALTFWREKER